MADPLGAAGSIVGIAAFGLQFATALQTYIETAADARETLRDIAFDISATASALEQLHEFTKANENGKAIANDSGVQQVIRLATQCKQVYTAIIDLIAKAAGIPRDSNGQVSLDALDLNTLNAISLMQKLKWPFKEPRIKKHQEELRWLKISLLFHLRLMELAKTKMMTPVTSPSAWEREAALQATLEKLLGRREEYARQIAAERRQSKRKELGKTAEAPVRASPIFTEEEIRARDPSVEPKISASISHRSLDTDKGLFESNKDDDIPEVKDTSPSREFIADPLSYIPPNQIQKPPKAKSNSNNNSHVPDPIIPGPAIEPFSISSVENTGKERDIGSLAPPDPTLNSFVQMLAHISPASSPAPFNTQSSTVDIVNNKVAARTDPTNTSNEKSNPHNQPIVQPTLTSPINEEGNPQSQPTAQSNSESAGSKNNKEGNPQNHIIEHLNEMYKLRPPRRAFRSLPRLSSLFSRRDKIVHNWENEELEAYLIEEELNPTSTSTSASAPASTNTNVIRKLPFGHRELASMLRQIIKPGNADIWTQYISLTPAQRKGVDQAFREAHRSSMHKRTCVAITSSLQSQPRYTNSCIVIFFALGPPVAPIHFKYGLRYFQFAFELCRTWEGMEDMMARALSDVDGSASRIWNGEYILTRLDDRTILPEMWSSVVSPGLVVFLVAVLPPPPPSPRRLGLIPGHIPGPMAPPQNNAVLPPPPAPFGRAPSSGWSLRSRSSSTDDSVALCFGGASRHTPRSRSRSPPAPVPLQSPQPTIPQTAPTRQGFPDDLDFAATVAGGLQSSGFDPDVVIDEPTFRRRDSPPVTSKASKKGKEKEEVVESESSSAQERADKRLAVRVWRGASHAASASPAGSDSSFSNLSETSEKSRPWFGSRRSARSSYRALERGAERTIGAPMDAESDGSDVGGEEVDIIDFEAEEEIARLGLGGLLGKWTNAPAEDGQHE
ncbi:hypothetical protein F4776DRAFT_640220 [Hypoxylon sp. NC0597]|nr:hypothetical protein F4776DRAFT_640220 [Hypoxylon sp. NC0597]